MPEIIWYDSVGSTNAVALDLFSQGRCSAFWFAAGEQTAGRGREGRAWDSRPGNLYASLLWPVPNVPLDRLAGLSLVDAYLKVNDLVPDVAKDSFQSIPFPEALSVLAKPLPVYPALLLSMVPSTLQNPVWFS